MRGLPHPLERSEVAQQRLLAALAHAGDVLQRRAEVRARRISFCWKVMAKRCASSRSRVSMNSSAEFCGRTMGSLRLEQEDALAGSRALSASRSSDLQVAALGQAHHVQPLDAQRPSSPRARVASWPLPPSMTSRSGRSVVLQAALEPAGEHLVHRGEVVLLVERLDLEAAVARLVRLAVGDRHLRGDDASRPGSARCRSTPCAAGSCAGAAAPAAAQHRRPSRPWCACAPRRPARRSCAPCSTRSRFSPRWGTQHPHPLALAAR